MNNVVEMFKLGSELPKDLLKKVENDYKGVSILSTGRLNLTTGEHKVFNVAGNGQSVIEVWEVKTYKSVNMFRTEEKISYRFVVTSGTEPIFSIGSQVLFKNYLSHGKLFEGKMVDYIDSRGFNRLKEKYSNSGASYVYK